jgi:trimethylamine--corrinoid protein Co-methyltransferase
MSEPTGNTGRRKRGGGRSGNARRDTGVAIQQLPWQIPQILDNPTEPLDAEGVAAVDNGAMRILEEIGIDFLHEEAKAHLKAAGADVDPDSNRVRFDRDLVREMAAKAPSQFTITPRNTERAIPIGGRNQVYINVSSPPNCSDLDRGRRPGTRESFRDLVKLSQYFNCIHMVGGYPVEPVDIHPSVRHLDCIRDKLVLCDKVMHAYSLGTERVEDAMEMIRIAGGLSHAEFDAKPRMYTNINSTSPLIHDWPMLDGAMRMAKRGQMVSVTPFTLAGAMAPVTLAGAIAQQTAEALAAIVLLQQINPGTPVVMGSFTSNVDMKSGAPAFGTPEYMRATQMSGQMARLYNLPLRATNACAANCPDAQAAWESAFSLWACTSGHANMVYHSAGWLEGGLCASYEKFVMDCETLQQMMMRATSLASSTPRTATRPPSTSPSCRTGAISRPGRKPAPCKLPNAPTASGRRSSRSLKPRPWTRPLSRNSTPSSNGARPRAARRPISEAKYAHLSSAQRAPSPLVGEGWGEGAAAGGHAGAATFNKGKRQQ